MSHLSTFEVLTALMLVLGSATAEPTACPDVGDSTALRHIDPRCIALPAQDAIGISCGELVQGSIDQPAEVDQYTFSAKAGDVVSLTLSDTAGEFVSDPFADARATLLSPTGVSLGSFDANGQRQFTLPEDGVYTVNVNANDLASTGSYNLNLECVVPPGSDAGGLECGDFGQGSIDQPAEVDQYAFHAGAGDVVSLTLSDTSGVFVSDPFADARATLFSPSGNALGLFDANGQRQFDLPEDGTYVVQISANNLTSTGAYILNLECVVPSSPDAVAPGCGGLMQGAIDQPAEVDQFTFNGGQVGTIMTGVVPSGLNAPGGEVMDGIGRGWQVNSPRKNVISITLTDTAGEFDNDPFADARATLFSPTGASLGHFDANNQRQFTLPTPGPYVIQVNANDLVSTGAYSLNLECMIPADPDVAVAMTCGDIEPGIIGEPAEVDQFTFNAQAGEVITLTLADTAGDFLTDPFADARLTLFPPSGPPSLGLFDANGQRPFTLPESGTYLIQINANDLKSTGSYNLSLSCI